MASDICVSLGERIRQLRKEKGWRQIDLAEASGVPEVSIGYYERGEMEMGIRALVKISAALGVTPSSLLDVVTRDIPN
ncbi:helix-turn-helix domain-containing protein [Terriglobus albidus]|uniref:helix-turn-helix domain-containing protein n=1 Tax=Terriglobus albidus TaxID=1592106 RepID=UPI0037D9B676